MKDLENKLGIAFSEFEESQARFLLLASTRVNELLNSLPQWETERQKMTAILQFLLSNLKTQLDNGDIEQKAGEGWLRRLEALIDRENEIYMRLREIREDLQSRLHRIKGKKTALSGYHSRNMHEPACFLSKDA